jgi:hypothetical protein
MILCMYVCMYGCMYSLFMTVRATEDCPETFENLAQVVATPELSGFYTEKLVYLPPSFYATSYR